MHALERVDLTPEQAWLGALAGAVATIVAAAAAFPKTIYWGFIWRYFWGPVYADAQSARCAVHYVDSGRTVLDPVTGGGCTPTGVQAYVAEPGYTLVSEAGYMAILLFMLGGVYLLLRRLDLEPFTDFFFALVPWMLFGGALRVVEDAFDATPEGVQAAVTYPLNTLLISPIIYFTVFVLALAALLGAKWLQRAGLTESYHYTLGVAGTVLTLASVLYLTAMAFTTGYVDWHPMVLVTTVSLSTVFAAVFYYGGRRIAPWIHGGTALMGPVVVWGHSIDGVANVLIADWASVFNLPEYGAKHPINRIIVDITQTVQPGALSAAIGTSWPFLVVKLAVAGAIVALFDEEFVETSPRYAVMLLGTIVAVGLGPGTRDMIRATFGI